MRCRYSCRGRAYANIGDRDKAVADYDRALRIDPNCADAYNSLAWLQATCPVARYRDGKKALKNARKACDLRAELLPPYTRGGLRRER